MIRLSNIISLDNLFNIYTTIYLDNYFDFKYKTKSGIYFISNNIAAKIGIKEENIYSFGVLIVIQNPYGFYLEYKPDFNNDKYHITNKIAYWGSHNWYQIYNDEQLQSMSMNDIKWYYSTLEK